MRGPIEYPAFVARVVDNALVTFELRAADNALIDSFSSEEIALVIAREVLRESDRSADSVLLQRLTDDREVLSETLLVLRDGTAGSAASS
jgi:hypothetical protein